MNDVIVYLGYARPKSRFAIFSYIIRFFERTVGDFDSSHAFVEYNDWIIESNFPVGRRVFKEKWLKQYHVTEKYPFKISVNYRDMDYWVEKNIVDRPYSLAQNVVIGASGALIQLVNPKKWSWVEKFRFNGRAAQNCTEAQIMFAKKFLKFKPIQGLDHYSIGEARDFVRSVWEVRGMK